MASHNSRPLKGFRILSVCLNLPGPAALMRCHNMGARCVKIEPLPPAHAVPGTSADPMGLYNRSAYEVLHQGIRVCAADLKTDKGQGLLHRELAKADLLLTSFRPIALAKLGLAWRGLHGRYPGLSQVAIVGSAGARANEPGHDLTYLAQNGLVQGLALPPTLFADMGGAMMAVEAVLSAALNQRVRGRGALHQVALADAATYLALPRAWGLTLPGAAVGGGHAGYRVYPCRDGRVAVAALEPHFAKTLCSLAGLQKSSLLTLFDPATHAAFTAFFATKSCAQLDVLAMQNDIPLQTMPTR